MLDIEGTVAPISFVYEVMYPYAKKKLTAYLEKHWATAELQAELVQLQDAVSSLSCPLCTLHCSSLRLISFL